MADFPNGIYDPRVKLNRPNVTYDENKAYTSYAEDITFLDAEVVALETFLRGGSKMVGIATTAGGSGTERLWVDGSGFLRYS